MDDERRIRDKDEAHGRTTGPVVKESFLESRMKPSKIEYGARQGGDAFILVALLSAPPCAVRVDTFPDCKGHIDSFPLKKTTNRYC